MAPMKRTARRSEGRPLARCAPITPDWVEPTTAVFYSLGQHEDSARELWALLSERGYQKEPLYTEERSQLGEHTYNWWSAVTIY